MNDSKNDDANLKNGYQSDRNKKIIVFVSLLLTLLVSLPLFKQTYLERHSSGNLSSSSTKIVYALVCYAFSGGFIAMGLSLNNFSRALPLLIAAASLMASIYFMHGEYNDSVDGRVAYFIITAWAFIHIAYLSCGKFEIRLLLSIIILILGGLATFFFVVFGAMGHSFESSSGMPFSKGIVIFPSIILGPYIIISIARSICIKISNKKTDD